MGIINDDLAIKREILRLSLRIALVQYDLTEAVIKKIPLHKCTAMMEELCVMQIQRTSLRNGRFEKLPYKIRNLYR